MQQRTSWRRRRCHLQGCGRLLAPVMALALLFSPAMAQVDPVRATHNGVNDRPFLEMMGRVEGPGGFNDVTRATSLRPERPLVSLTIAEVLAFQRRVRASGAASSAVGRFQFIYPTLSDMVESLDIDTELPFDAFTQTALARMQMARCGFYEPIASETAVANCLARIWAALPVVSGARAGRSHYDGVAGNRALVSRSEFLDALRQRFPDAVLAHQGTHSGIRRPQ